MEEVGRGNFVLYLAFFSRKHLKTRPRILHSEYCDAPYVAFAQTTPNLSTGTNTILPRNFKREECVIGDDEAMLQLISGFEAAMVTGNGNMLAEISSWKVLLYPAVRAVLHESGIVRCPRYFFTTYIASLPVIPLL